MKWYQLMVSATLLSGFAGTASYAFDPLEGRRAPRAPLALLQSPETADLTPSTPRDVTSAGAFRTNACGPSVAEVAGMQNRRPLAVDRSDALFDREDGRDTVATPRASVATVGLTAR